MSWLKKNALFKFATLFVVTAFVLAAAQFAPGIGVASAADLDIYVNGVAKPGYTYTQLGNLPQYEDVFYSSWNTYPEQKEYVATGPALADVLAPWLENAQTITVQPSDWETYGGIMTFTIDELLTARYSYIYDPDTGKVVSSTIVPTILALDNSKDRLRLMMGQRTPAEQTNVWMIKKINRIDISTLPPAPWDPPTANLTGTEVTLNQEFADKTKGDNIGVKIYFTRDGTTPTINSEMFNVSAWYLPNPTIPYTSGLTIKAIVIGPGKSNSPVATFPPFTN